MSAARRASSSRRIAIRVGLVSTSAPPPLSPEVTSSSLMLAPPSTHSARVPAHQLSISSGWAATTITDAAAGTGVAVISVAYGWWQFGVPHPAIIRIRRRDGAVRR